MGYPTGIFAPATRSNGQTIDASHVNDLQDEVVALETQLLGTITHSVNVSGASTLATVQAGASTVASLVVSGGSTLGTLQAGASTHTSLSVSGGSTLGILQAGASTHTSLNVTGGSTLASLSVSGGSTVATLQCAGSSFSVRPITPPPDMALVFLQSTGAVGSSATSTLTFLSQSILTNSSMHSTASNADRLVPQSTGVYRITAQLRLDGASSNQVYVGIKDSSNVFIGLSLGTASTASVLGGIGLQASAFKRFDALGGHAIFEYGQAGGSTASLSTGLSGTWFSMVKL